MEENRDPSILDIIPAKVGEKLLSDYISGKLSTPLSPSEEADGTIDLHGPDGQVIAKCYDASSAVFFIQCMAKAATLDMMKLAQEQARKANNGTV